MNNYIISFFFSFTFLIIIAIIFLYFAKHYFANSISLPCFTIFTSIIYFFIIPFTLKFDLSSNYLGIYFSDANWMHFSVFLYILGMAMACRLFQNKLNCNVYEIRLSDRSYNEINFYLITFVSLAGITYQIYNNKLNIFSLGSFQFNKEQINEFAFVNLSFNLLIPLMLVTLIKRKFDIVSLFFLLILFWVILQAGFRYRLLILSVSTGTAFFIANNYKIRMAYTVGGAVFGVFLVNLLGMVRRYGEGIDLSRLDNVEFGNVLTSFSGEAGIAFILDYTSRQPLPPLVTFEPWTVAIARLIPSFLWADKPQASYLDNIIAGTTAANAELAGAAAPQQVEMLFQFGWPGVPILAFLYFSFAAILLGWINRLGREARIAGFAMVPVYFGYYMQTRGYFSQILSDGLFFFLPLFMIHWFDSQRPNGRQSSANARLAHAPRAERY